MITKANALNVAKLEIKYGIAYSMGMLTHYGYNTRPYYDYLDYSICIGREITQAEEIEKRNEVYSVNGIYADMLIAYETYYSALEKKGQENGEEN